MKWISVKDNLPIEDQDVLCFSPKNEEYNDSILIGYYYKVDNTNIWWCTCRQDVGPFYPTYWMPLPNKPTNSKD